MVYSCPVLGKCEGVRGNISRYNDTENTANNRITDQLIFAIRSLYPQALSEGRLFDQARKFQIHFYYFYKGFGTVMFPMDVSSSCYISSCCSMDD